MTLIYNDLGTTQKLDPLSPEINSDLANAYTVLRDYDRAAEQARKTLELEKDYVPSMQILAESLEGGGQEQEAFQWNLRASRLTGFPPDHLTMLQSAFDAGGMRAYRQKHLELYLADGQKKKLFPYQIGWFYARLGDKQNALDWLERAYREHDFFMAYLKNFDFVRAEPRFRELVRRVGLPE